MLPRVMAMDIQDRIMVVYNFCAHRQDGDYSIGCTSCYISCSAKRPIAMECPAGLVLDEASDSCVGRAYAKVCGGIPTTTIPPPASEATTLRPYCKIFMLTCTNDARFRGRGRKWKEGDFGKEFSLFSRHD
ncbi:Chondroitin proteoglycan 1 [Toxocara canis]|uniref:Chondroitin proteoglycan 1 n=1 Tax=Toxocara canis TaxID=6265 RepID=A0A0B2USB2_TOXCA|nr:Chondroitin proteoglycan 1 [Toxocara canis]